MVSRQGRGAGGKDDAIGGPAGIYSIAGDGPILLNLLREEIQLPPFHQDGGVWGISLEAIAWNGNRHGLNFEAMAENVPVCDVVKRRGAELIDLNVIVNPARGVDVGGIRKRAPE